MSSPGLPRTPYRIGIPNRGRLFSEAASLVRAAFGIEVTESRSLLHLGDADLELLCARAEDLPRLVEQGICNAAITGADYACEHGRNLVVRAELGLCTGTVCLLAPHPVSWPPRGRSARIASQYPRIAEAWLAEEGLQATVVPVSGAAELYPRVGLAEAVVDVVSTGRTAEENGLAVVAEIMSTSGCLFIAAATAATADERGQAVAGALLAAVSTEPA